MNQEYLRNKSFGKLKPDFLEFSYLDISNLIIKLCNIYLKF